MKKLTLFLCLQTLLLFLFSMPATSESAELVSQVIDLSGEGAYEIFPGKAWQFVGPVRSITLGNRQKIAVSATAVLGTNSGNSRAALAICYQRGLTDPPVPFVGDDHLNATVDQLQRPYTVHASSDSSRGTVTVGFCVVNQGTEIIGNNNYVNGWILVTN